MATNQLLSLGKCANPNNSAANAVRCIHCSVPVVCFCLESSGLQWSLCVWRFKSPLPCSTSLSHRLQFSHRILAGCQELSSLFLLVLTLLYSKVWTLNVKEVIFLMFTTLSSSGSLGFISLELRKKSTYEFRCHC